MTSHFKDIAMRKNTKKAQIIKLLKSGKTAKEVAEMMNTNIHNVYSVRYLHKKKQNKVPAVKVAPPTVERMNVIANLEDKIEALNIQIANQKHQIIGYCAVISYLENLAEIRNSQ
jgi:hypothetical protein